MIFRPIRSFDMELQKLDQIRNSRDAAERMLSQYDNQVREIKNELLEKLYRWEKENQHLK